MSAVRSDLSVGVLRRICGFWAAVLLIGAPVAAPAQGMDEIRWQYSQFNDPDNRGRSTSQITIGVPETDLVVGRAICFAGSTSGLPMLELAAAFEGPVPENVPIEFATDTGPIAFTGFGKRPLSEEDYSGVQIQPDMNDPLWSSLQRMGLVQYRVGGVRYDLLLRGSSRVIAQFLADCQIYHGNFNPNAEVAGPADAVNPNSETVSAAPATDPRWETCDGFNTVRSQNSDTPVTMTFTNNSDGYRVVFWIGFDGMPVEYATLNPGERFTIQTFLTHPWMFTDGPGNCIEMFMPQLGVEAFNISAPGRYFGPE